MPPAFILLVHIHPDKREWPLPAVLTNPADRISCSNSPRLSGLIESPSQQVPMAYRALSKQQNQRTDARACHPPANPESVVKLPRQTAPIGSLTRVGTSAPAPPLPRDLQRINPAHQLDRRYFPDAPMRPLLCQRLYLTG